MKIERIVGGPVGRLVLLGLASAGCWGVWMGWDTEYDRDPSGAVSGPYQPWQVIGCVLCLIVVGVFAPRWVNPVGAVGVITVAFASAWWASAAAHDRSGLSFVGLSLLLPGVLVGATLVVGVAEELWGRERPVR